ncbi:MAG: hypothetical protein R6W89_06635 [Candidatus Hydrogenedentota bacterium]
MSMHHTAPRITGALVITLALAFSAAAEDDLKLTIEMESEGTASIAGLDQPEEDYEATMWFGDGQFRRDDQDRSVITLLGEEQTVYVIDHAEQSYVALDLPIDLMAVIPEEQRPMIEQMMEQMQPEVEVETTDEEDTIGEWNARKSIITVTAPMGITITHEVWLTDELDVEQRGYEEATRALSEMSPIGGDWVEKLSELEGFPVLTETVTEVMGRQTTSRERVVSAEETTAPEGTYELPEGYTEDAMDIFGGP